jgi:threonine/homoserine/homoserine lactone efflux protein
VLRQAIGELLPAALAVALSPIPIVGVVLILDGARARRNGPAFALGWLAGLSVVSVIVVFVVGAASNPGSDTATGVNWFMAALGLAFLVMATRQWKKRPKRGETAQMPTWMKSVASMSSTKALGLGAALAAANPKNLALTLAASAAIANAELGTADTAAAIVAFVAIASITVVGAVAFFLVAPAKAEAPLGAVKDFMGDNSITILVVILVILGAKLLGDALAGVWS